MFRTLKFSEGAWSKRHFRGGIYLNPRQSAKSAAKVFRSPDRPMKPILRSQKITRFLKLLQHLWRHIAATDNNCHDLSPVLYECMIAGRVIDVPEQATLSESTSGGLEPESVTVDLCKRGIDASMF